MRKIAVIIFIVLQYYKSNAQIEAPVHWSYAAKKISSTEAIVFIRATIDNPWHIYSTTQKDGGPIKTSFEFNRSKAYKLLGSVQEPKPFAVHDKTFNMEVKYFENSVTFQQKVMLTSKDAVVNGKVTFMTCNDHQCLPPDDVEFSIPVK